MRIARLCASLVIAASLFLVAATGSAQSAATPTNMTVGVVVVTYNGILIAIPASGTLKLTSGAAAPACSGGTINAGQTATGTVYSDVIKDRFQRILTGAQLSGRTVQVGLSRNASNQCFIESIWAM